MKRPESSRRDSVCSGHPVTARNFDGERTARQFNRNTRYRRHGDPCWPVRGLESALLVNGECAMELVSASRNCYEPAHSATREGKGGAGDESNSHAS
jgi:hypothetical protein